MEREIINKLEALFREKDGYTGSATEKKLSEAILVSLCNEAGTGLDRSQQQLSYFDFDEWSGSNSWLTDTFIEFPGTRTRRFVSVSSVDELNHMMVFRYEITEFVLCCWLLDLLLNLDGMKSDYDRIIDAHSILAKEGITSILDRTKSPLVYNFSEPGVWYYLEDEEICIGGAYYLYSVLFGQDLPEKIRRYVEACADLRYLNHVIIRLLEMIGERGDLPSSDTHFEGWMSVLDPVVREVIKMLVSTMTVLDGGETNTIVYSSSVIAVFLSRRKKLPTKEEKLLSGLLGTMLQGQSERIHCGLSDAWPGSAKGVTKSGRYLDARSFSGCYELDRWGKHSAALFHILAKKWLKDEIL